MYRKKAITCYDNQVMETQSKSKMVLVAKVRRLGIVCGFSAVAAVLLCTLPPVQQSRSGLTDWLIRIAPKPNPPVAFGLLLIDASSLDLDQIPPDEIAKSKALGLMVRGFPWSREVYAEAIRRVLEAGARLVILDVLLVGEREGDRAMQAVLADYPDRIVLVSNFVEDISGDGHVINRYQVPLDGDLPTGARVGFANFWRDTDGIVRSAPFRMVRPGGELVYSSPAQALGLLLGEEARNALPNSAGFIPCMEGLRPDFQVPLWQIFSEATWEANLKGGEVLRDRVLALGASAPQFHDDFATPVGPVVGAELHLGVLGAAMEGALYFHLGWWATAAGCLLGAGFVSVIWVILLGLLSKALGLTLGALALFASSLGLLVGQGLMPPTFEVLLAGSLTVVGALTSDLITEGRERLRARRILERYVSPEVTREILDNRSDFLEALGGAQRTVTVLFSDLRGFTAHSEHGEPSQVFDELNEYFSYMVAEILRTGGWVDKFLGDGILAVWGVLPRRTPAEEAKGALDTCLGMRNALATINAARQSRGLSLWRVGIGIHSGEVLFGNLGTHAKMEPTVIGDTVNLTSRIEGYTKALGVEVLFSETTLACASRKEDFRPADHVRLVGRSEGTELFTLWPQEFSNHDKEIHCSGIAKFRAGEMALAKSHFEHILTAHPTDALSATYRERCKEFLANPLPSDWNGIVLAASK